MCKFYCREILLSLRRLLLSQAGTRTRRLTVWVRTPETAQIQKRSGDPNPQYFSKSTAVQIREVLHGVGADGVGAKFPIFAVNCCCLPLSFSRPLGKKEKSKEKRKKKKKKKLKNV